MSNITLKITNVLSNCLSKVFPEPQSECKEDVCDKIQK